MPWELLGDCPTSLFCCCWNAWMDLVYCASDEHARLCMHSHGQKNYGKHSLLGKDSLSWSLKSSVQQRCIYPGIDLGQNRILIYITGHLQTHLHGGEHGEGPT